MNVCGYMLVTTVVVIYIYISIRVSTLVLTMVSRTLLGWYVLRQYQLCTNICLVREPEVISSTGYIYLLYISFNTRCILAPSQPKISLGLQYKDWAGYNDGSFKRTQYQDQAGMSKSWYPTNNMHMDGCNDGIVVRESLASNKLILLR